MWRNSCTFRSPSARAGLRFRGHHGVRQKAGHAMPLEQADPALGPERHAAGRVADDKTLFEPILVGGRRRAGREFLAQRDQFTNQIASDRSLAQLFERGPGCGQGSVRLAFHLEKRIYRPGDHNIKIDEQHRPDWPPQIGSPKPRLAPGCHRRSSATRSPGRAAAGR